MRNNILLVTTTMLLMMIASCTQGNLGTDVGNPLPDESDVLLPVKHAGFCFVFGLEPGMEWADVGDAKVSISDGDSEVLLGFADVSGEYKSPFVINTPDAMEASDKYVLLTYAGAGFAYDESWDFPTAVMDSGSEREIVHLNPRARMAVTMSGEKSFVSGIGVSLDTSKEECLRVPELSPGDKSPKLPQLNIPDLVDPNQNFPRLNTDQLEAGNLPIVDVELEDESERLEVREGYRLAPGELRRVDEGN